ncbi:hypothetical protein MHTCC0001_37160 [Flavobacteriaceae bacterium MHTCC 0001]
MLETMDEITDRMDRGDPVDIIYLDFQKTFDSLPHVGEIVEIWHSRKCLENC